VIIVLTEAVVSGQKCSVNSEHIVRFQRWCEGTPFTLVCLTNSETLTVTESPECIRGLLGQGLPGDL
jgi:hypothetical protein